MKGTSARTTKSRQNQMVSEPEIVKKTCKIETSERFNSSTGPLCALRRKSRSVESMRVDHEGRKEEKSDQKTKRDVVVRVEHGKKFVNPRGVLGD